jgi:hypothetical protein
MNESEAENLIERGLSIGRLQKKFSDQLLGESTAALVRGVRGRARWRTAGLVAATVVVAGVSFLGGRLSAPPREQGREVTVRTAAEAGGVSVPHDLVAWLEAARLFKQLGMEDRMARAVDRAAGRLPDAAAEERPSRVELPVLPRLRGSMEGAGRIFAQSIGD